MLFAGPGDACTVHSASSQHRGRRRDSIAAGLFALAGLLEFMQLRVPGRSGEVVTVFTSGFGGLLGMALAWAVSTRLVMARSAAAWTRNASAWVLR